MSDETFKCSCEGCEGHLEVSVENAGMTVECPHCHESTRLIPPVGTVQSGLRISTPDPGSSVSALHQERAVQAPSRRMRRPSKPRGKNWLTTFLLAFFLGGLGIDRFYNGRMGLGIGKLVTGGGCGLWSLTDVLLLLFKRYQDAQGNTLQPAKRSHMVMALSIVGGMILLNLIFFGTAVQSVRSELAGMKTEFMSELESANIQEALNTQVQGYAAGEGHGASSPVAAFEEFQKAVRENNYSAAFPYLTLETQVELLKLPVAMYIMARKGMADPQVRKEMEGMADSQFQNEIAEVEMVLGKHGLPFDPAAFDKQTLTSVKDRGRCFQELTEAMSGFGNPGLPEAFESVTLANVIMDNDTAIGEVGEAQMKFKRLNDLWFVDLADELAEEFQMLTQVAFQSDAVWQATGKAKAKADRIRCINNLKQLGQAFHQWARHHNNQFPFNVPAGKGGTREYGEQTADGFDANGFRHFQVISDGLIEDSRGSTPPKVLVCPADTSRAPATDWKSLNSSHVTYLLRSGTQLTDGNADEVLARCPIDGNTLYCDGQVKQERNR